MRTRRWTALVVAALAAGAAGAGGARALADEAGPGAGKPPPAAGTGAGAGAAAEREKWGEHMGDLPFVVGYEKGMKEVEFTGRPPMYFFTTTW